MKTIELLTEAKKPFVYGGSIKCDVLGYDLTIGHMDRHDVGEIAAVSNDLRKIAQYMVNLVRQECGVDSKVSIKHELIGYTLDTIMNDGGKIVAVIVTSPDDRTDFTEEVVDGVIFTNPKAPVVV